MFMKNRNHWWLALAAGMFVTAILEASNNRSLPAIGSRSYELGNKLLAPTKIMAPAQDTKPGKIMRDPLRGPVKALGTPPKPKVVAPRKREPAKLSFRRLEISGEVQTPRLVFESEELNVPFTEPEVAADFFNKTLEDASRETLIKLPTNP